jgi:hypothetical protein
MHSFCGCYGNTMRVRLARYVLEYTHFTVLDLNARVVTEQKDTNTWTCLFD